MLKFKPPVVLQLQKGQLIRCDQATRATLVRVVCGRVWVTQAGDRQDHFLSPGASLRVPARTLALLGAETDAQVAFSTPASRAAALLGRLLAPLAHLWRRPGRRPARAGGATHPATG